MLCCYKLEWMMAVMISDQEKIPDMFSISIHPFLEQEGEKKKVFSHYKSNFCIKILIFLFSFTRFYKYH